MTLPPVPLSSIVVLQPREEGDESWKIVEDNYHGVHTKALLESYLVQLLAGKNFQGKRAGEVVFMIGDTGFDLYALMDERLSQHMDEPYVVHGVLVYNEYRVAFYKWEHLGEGRVERNSCDRVFNLVRPREVRNVIGPAILGMFKQVGKASDDVSVLEAGVDCKKTSPGEIRKQANWMDYPTFVMV